MTTTITEYSPIEAGLADLRSRYAGVAWDLRTVAGNEAARKARKELVSLRTTLEERRKELKAPLLDKAKLIDTEAKRITGELLAIETPIDEQIKADEARRESERKAKAEAERQRVAAIRAQIDGIAAKAAGAVRVRKSSAAAGVLAELLAVEVDDVALAEYADEARKVLADAIEAVRAHVAGLKEQEAEAARIAAERAELERQKAEAAERERAERERLAAERAEQDRIARETRAAEEARLRAIREQQEAEARAERERLEAAQAEVERQRQEQERAAREQQERLEAEARAERERIEAARAAYLREQEEREIADRKRREEIERQAEDLARREREQREREEAEQRAAEAARVRAAHIAMQEASRIPIETEATACEQTSTFDLISHLARQIAFSKRTFGPGARLEGVIDHIARELIEVRESGGALEEWVDVIILAFDGAWRSGASPAQIVAAIVAKQEKNEVRKWPDWRTADRGRAIEHLRDTQDAAQA